MVSLLNSRTGMMSGVSLELLDWDKTWSADDATSLGCGSFALCCQWWVDLNRAGADAAVVAYPRGASP